MKSLLILVFFLFSATFSIAQKELYNDVQKKKQQILSTELTTQQNQNYQKALKMY
jgi:hypothetical protein